MEASDHVSYLDIAIGICGGRYTTNLYDKRDNFGFDIVDCLFMSSNIPAKPTYGVYISQLIRISRICESISAFSS